MPGDERGLLRTEKDGAVSDVDHGTDPPQGVLVREETEAGGVLLPPRPQPFCDHVAWQYRIHANTIRSKFVANCRVIPMAAAFAVS